MTAVHPQSVASADSSTASTSSAPVYGHAGSRGKWYFALVGEYPPSSAIVRSGRTTNSPPVTSRSLTPLPPAASRSSVGASRPSRSPSTSRVCSPSRGAPVGVSTGSPTRRGYGACWRSGPTTGSSTVTRSPRAATWGSAKMSAAVYAVATGTSHSMQRSIDLGRGQRRGPVGDDSVDLVAARGAVGQAGEARIVRAGRPGPSPCTDARSWRPSRRRCTRTCRRRWGSCRAAPSWRAGCPRGCARRRAGRRPAASTRGCGAPRRRGRRR